MCSSDLIVRQCTLPLTGRRCVDMIITELGVFEMDRNRRRFMLTEIAPDVTVDEVKSKTEAEFLVSSTLKTMA